MSNFIEIQKKEILKTIDFKKIKSPETWELFARDFLQSLGFLLSLILIEDQMGKRYINYRNSKWESWSIQVSMAC